MAASLPNISKPTGFRRISPPRSASAHTASIASSRYSTTESIDIILDLMPAPLRPSVVSPVSPIGEEEVTISIDPRDIPSALPPKYTRAPRELLSTSQVNSLPATQRDVFKPVTKPEPKAVSDLNSSKARKARFRESSVVSPHSTSGLSARRPSNLPSPLRSPGLLSANDASVKKSYRTRLPSMTDYLTMEQLESAWSMQDTCKLGSVELVSKPQTPKTALWRVDETYDPRSPLALIHPAFRNQSYAAGEMSPLNVGGFQRVIY